MDIIIPSYLFSAISLLLMGYNTRYLILVKLIRDACINGYSEKIDKITIFRKRLEYIKKLQMYSLYSLISAVFSTILILLDLQWQREFFALALLFFMISLIFSIKEILLSTENI